MEIKNTSGDALIRYKPIKYVDKKNKIRIFGENFIKNNKDIKIIYKEEIYEIKEFIDDIDSNYSQEDFTIIIKDFNKITDLSYIFADCTSLYQISNPNSIDYLLQWGFNKKNNDIDNKNNTIADDNIIDNCIDNINNNNTEDKNDFSKNFVSDMESINTIPNNPIISTLPSQTATFDLFKENTKSEISKISKTNKSEVTLQCTEN